MSSILGYWGAAHFASLVFSKIKYGAEYKIFIQNIRREEDHNNHQIFIWCVTSVAAPKL